MRLATHNPLQQSRNCQYHSQKRFYSGNSSWQLSIAVFLNSWQLNVFVWLRYKEKKNWYVQVGVCVCVSVIVLRHYYKHVNRSVFVLSRVWVIQLLELPCQSVIVEWVWFEIVCKSTIDFLKMKFHSKLNCNHVKWRIQASKQATKQATKQFQLERLAVQVS